MTSLSSTTHFRVAVANTHPKLQSFLNATISELRDACQQPEGRIGQSILTAAEGLVFLGGYNFNCEMHNIDAEIALIRIAARVVRNVTLVPDDTLLVRSRGASGPWRNAADMPFLQRRRRNVPLAVLAIVLAIVVFVRAIVAAVWNNDADDALLLFVKRAAGLGCCDSLLGVHDVVRYDCKYQCGDVAHFGAEMLGLPEVDQFRGGVIDAVDARDTQWENESWADSA